MTLKLIFCTQLGHYLNFYACFLKVHIMETYFCNCQILKIWAWQRDVAQRMQQYDFFSIFKNFLLIFEKIFSISFCLQLMRIQKTFKIQFFRNSKKWAGSFLEPLIMHRIEKTLISRAQLARSARFQAKNRYGS